MLRGAEVFRARLNDVKGGGPSATLSVAERVDDLLAEELAAQIERIDKLETGLATDERQSLNVAALAMLRDFVCGVHGGGWVEPPTPAQVVNVAIRTIENRGQEIARLRSELGDAHIALAARDATIREAGLQIAELKARLDGARRRAAGL